MSNNFYRLIYVTKTEEEWLEENPVPRRASPRVTKPTETFPHSRFKLGNGQTPWAELIHFEPNINKTFPTPSPVFPFNKETVSLDVLYFEITPFASYYSIPQKGIDLQVATDPLFINRVYDHRHYGETNTVNPSKDAFRDNKTYYWRMRYIDQEDFISDWSSPHAFKSQKISPLIGRPRILEPVTPEVFTTEPIIQLSAFDPLLELDVHVLTHYQISKDIRFTDLVYDVITFEDLLRTRIPEDILNFETTYYIRARQSSGNQKWSNWSKRVRIRTRDLTVRPPNILVPTDTSLVLDDILVQLSAFETDPPNRDIHLFTQYEVLVKDKDVQPIYKLVSKTALRNNIIPSENLRPFIPYTLRVRYKGSRTDWSAWSTFSFSVKTPQIKTPQIIRPEADNIISLEAILETSPFIVLNTNDNFTHAATRFQIAKDPEFERIVHDTGIGDDLIQHTVPDGLLEARTTYFIRVRHKGEGLGWSLWSESVQAVTVDPIIAQPRVLNPDMEDDDVVLEPTIETSPFQVLRDTDTHAATQYQIYEVENPNLDLYDIIAHIDLTTHDVPFGVLKTETKYAIRVRHKGTRFSWSAWSQAVEFTTRLPDIITPSVLRPIKDDTVDAPVVIQTTEFQTQTSDDDHIETHYQISKDDTFSTIAYEIQNKDDLLIYTVPESTLFQEDTYYVRVRHRGNAFGWSEWSDAVTFSILDTAPLVEATDDINGRILARVDRPTLIKPISDTGLSNQVLEIETSPFNVINGTDTQIASQYQIKRVSDNAIVYDSGPVNDFIKRNVRGDRLSFDVPYRVRARHKGQDLNWSDWSVPERFTLIASDTALIARPLVEKPSPSETVSRTSLTIETSPFSVVNGTDTHIGSQYRIAHFDAADGVFVYDSNETTDLLSQDIAESQLSADTVYRVWVRHKGDTLGWSDWSLPRIFDTLVKEGPYFEKPAIVNPVDGETLPNDSVTIEVSPFTIIDGTDTQVATQYRIFDAATNEIVYDSGATTDFISQDIPKSQLSFDQDYLVQARHKGSSLGWSNWSSTVRFTSAFSEDPFVEKTDILSPTDGGTVPEDGIDVQLSPFSATGQNDTQTATQYIGYQGTPNNTIYDSGATTDFTEKTIRPTGIDFNQPFTIQARQRGKDLGWGDWSDPVTFTVDETLDPFIAKPIIEKPANNNATISEDNIVINTSPFTVMGDTDTHTASQYKVEDTNGNIIYDSGPITDFTSHTIVQGTFPPNAQYNLTVRHLGETLGWSEWSLNRLFTLEEAPDPSIVKPNVLEPVANDQILEDSIRIRTSSFTVIDGTDTHNKTEYEIRRADDNSVVYTQIEVSNNRLTTQDVPEGNLFPDVTYKVRVRHGGENIMWSEWSDFVIFSVEAVPDPVILRPSIDVFDSQGDLLDSGTNNRTLDTDDFSLGLSPFQVENGSDTLVESQYQIVREDTDVVIHNANLTNGFDTYDPPENLLSKNVTYKVQGRYKGQNIGYSEWSIPITVELRLSVLKPQVIFPTQNSTGISTRPKIRSSSFNSEDPNDVHTATKYQIIDPTKTSPIERIVYETTTFDLLEHDVPASDELEKGKTYKVRLRHISSLPTSSPLSDFVSFTTEAEQGAQSFTTSGTFTVPNGVSTVSAVVVPGTGTSSFGTYVSQEPDEWDVLSPLDWQTISGSNAYRWSFGGDFDLSGNYWVVGGRDSSTQQESVSGFITDQVVSFDPNNINAGWTIRTSLPGQRRDHASVIDNDGFLWVIGGFDGVVALNNIIRLDTQNPNAGWSNPFNLQERFDFHQATLDLNGNIWVIGGRDGGRSFYNHDVYKITPDVNNPQIEIIPELDIGPSGRARQGMTVNKNGWLWMVGGQFEPTATASGRDLWRFDTNNPTAGWVVDTLSIPIFAKRITPVLAQGPDKYLYYISENALLRMDTDAMAGGWEIETPSPTQTVRRSHGFVDAQSRIWIVGGLDMPGVIRADTKPGPNQLKGTSFDVSGTQIQDSGPYGSDGEILKWKNNISLLSNVTTIPVTVSPGDGTVRVIWGSGTSFPNNMP